jgi:hypothetical protein
VNVVWNAGLTKEPEIQRIIKKNVYALRREWKGMRRWTRENKRNKKRWPYPWAKAIQVISISRLFGLLYKLASPRMPFLLSATPFSWVVSLGRPPREIETDVHPLLFFPSSAD